MPARLTLYPADQPARPFPLEPGREYLVGRGPDCDLRVEDPRLSRRHARLAHADSGWTFADLGSKNGTSLAGRATGETALRDGDWISFGGLLGQFAELSEARLAAEQARTRERWEDTVAESRRLDPQAGVEPLLALVLRAAMGLAGAERGFVMLVGADGRLGMRASSGAVGPLGAGLEFPGSRGALARSLAARAAVVICDTSEDTLLGAQPSVIAGEIRALACVPLQIGDRLSGLLYVDSRVPGKVFTQLDVEILKAFAAHAALVIGVAGVREDLAELSALLPPGITCQAPPGALLRRLETAVPALATPAAGNGP